MNQTDDDNDNGDDDDDDDDDDNDNELRNILHLALIKQSLYSPFKENKYDMKNYVELVGCCPPQPSASVDNTPSIYIILHTIKNVGVNVAFVLRFFCIYFSHFTSLCLIKTENKNSFLWTSLSQTITKSLIIEKTNICTGRFLIDFSRVKTLMLLVFKR